MSDNVTEVDQTNIGMKQPDTLRTDQTIADISGPNQST